MSVCYLVGAGSFTLRELQRQEGDFIIAADGGYTALSAAGIIPDLLVGDLDSIGTVPSNVPVITFPPEKDMTDMALAMAEGIARGYRTFRLYGASGGREDHTYANLQLLGGASRQGFDCKMICPDFDVYAVTNGTLRLPIKQPGKTISVFCHGSTATGVTLQGLKYPLRGATLTADSPLGVSNETTGDIPVITVTQGTLLVYHIV